MQKRRRNLVEEVRSIEMGLDMKSQVIHLNLAPAQTINTQSQ